MVTEVTRGACYSEKLQEVHQGLRKTPKSWGREGGKITRHRGDRTRQNLRTSALP